MASQPFEKRFLNSFERRGDEECWPWIRHLSRGYGQIGLNYHTLQAHRVSYEYFVGPIPDGLFIDHLCRNPACVNPKHLEPVTNSENVRRQHVALRRTHCPQGHEYTTENTYVTKHGIHKCRECGRQQNRRRTRQKHLNAPVTPTENGEN